MSHQTTDNVPKKQKDEKGAPESTSPPSRVGLFILFLICSLAVFLFGSNYYKMFPTNGNWIYSAILSAVFLIAAILFKRSDRFVKYWQITYAFFVASSVNLVSALFASYNSAILQYVGLSLQSNQGMGLGKLYDALLVVIPILVLTKLSGADLGSLFLQKGSHLQKWGLGIGVLVLVNFLTSVLIFFGSTYTPEKLASAIVWGFVFAFSNSFLEELWLRGLFLKKLVPLLGSVGTILLTSIWFASLHFLSVAFLPAVVVPIFVVNTLTLGLACGILMLKTESLWGAYLVHAAADLFLFVAIMAAH
jgi:membrane protease YdiL (CAAX protease family)